MRDRKGPIASPTRLPSRRSAPQPGRVLINIGRAGILPDGDTMDLTRADVGAARDAIAKNRDFIVGVKARLSRDVAGANDYEVLRRAQEVATSFNLPVMIHMGQTMSPLPQARRSARSAATSSRTCSRRRPTASSTTAAASCRKCWRRGAAASGSTSATARPATCAGTSSSAIMKAGFWPDTFSTDWNAEQPHDRRHRLPELHVEAARLRHDARSGDRARDRQCRRACSRCSTTAARSMWARRPTWRCSSCARARSSSSTTTRTTITGRQRLFPSATVLGGKRIPARLTSGRDRRLFRDVTSSQAVSGSSRPWIVVHGLQACRRRGSMVDDTTIAFVRRLYVRWKSTRRRVPRLDGRNVARLSTDETAGNPSPPPGSAAERSLESE